MSPLTSGDSEETSDWDVGVGRVCEGQEWERVPLTSMLPTSFSSGVHWCGWASCFRYRLGTDSTGLPLCVYLSREG